jgi:CheY-like chemotaxis protein
LKILLTDNDKFSRLIIEKILKSMDYKSIETAKNGREALDLCLTNKYDIIFMDYLMPVMSGLEAVTAIRKSKNKNTTIVALSGNALTENREECYKTGMDYFILKPTSAKVLDDTIRSIILN